MTELDDCAKAERRDCCTGCPERIECKGSAMPTSLDIYNMTDEQLIEYVTQTEPMDTDDPLDGAALLAAIRAGYSQPVKLWLCGLYTREDYAADLRGDKPQGFIK